jgi:membrane-bound metal-dependent hydrolase YbcI (DUF457 family)
MSSPLGHSLAGWVIIAWREKSVKPKNLKMLALYIFIANAPDLDFIPGILAGKPNLYHHGLSHSIGAGLLFALPMAFLINLKFWLKSALKSWKRIWRDFFFMLSLYGSHLILDFICIDGRPPFGIPILWPFTDRYFMIPLLPPVKHSHLDHATIAQVLADIFSMHNLYVICLETILTVPFALIIVWRFRKHRPQTIEKQM